MRIWVSDQVAVEVRECLATEDLLSLVRRLGHHVTLDRAGDAVHVDSALAGYRLVLDSGSPEQNRPHDGWILRLTRILAERIAARGGIVGLTREDGQAVEPALRRLRTRLARPRLTISLQAGLTQFDGLHVGYSLWRAPSARRAARHIVREMAYAGAGPATMGRGLAWDGCRGVFGGMRGVSLVIAFGRQLVAASDPRGLAAALARGIIAYCHDPQAKPLLPSTTMEKAVPSLRAWTERAEAPNPPLEHVADAAAGARAVVPQTETGEGLMLATSPEGSRMETAARALARIVEARGLPDRYRPLLSGTAPDASPQPPLAQRDPAPPAPVPGSHAGPDRAAAAVVRANLPRRLPDWYRPLLPGTTAIAYVSAASPGVGLAPAPAGSNPLTEGAPRAARVVRSR